MKKQFAAMKRKVRISYADPDATDEESDQERLHCSRLKPKRMVHEICIQKPAMLRALRATPLKKKHNIDRRALLQKSRARFNCLRRRKLCKQINTAEETCRAFLFKKSQLEKMLQESDQDKFSQESLPSKHEIRGSGSVDWCSEEDAQCVEVLEELVPVSCEAAVNGEFFPTTFGFLVNSGTPYYVPVVDYQGFLLGEFSSLDDLSICDF